MISDRMSAEHFERLGAGVIESVAVHGTGNLSGYELRAIGRKVAIVVEDVVPKEEDRGAAQEPTLPELTQHQLFCLGSDAKSVLCEAYRPDDIDVCTFGRLIMATLHRILGPPPKYRFGQILEMMHADPARKFRRSTWRSDFHLKVVSKSYMDDFGYELVSFDDGKMMSYNVNESGLFAGDWLEVS